MIREGQVVLFRFPTTGLAEGKLRPALVVRKLPGPYDDWLVCMISSQVDKAIEGFDEVIGVGDTDFRNLRPEDGKRHPAVAPGGSRAQDSRGCCWTNRFGAPSPDSRVPF